MSSTARKPENLKTNVLPNTEKLLKYYLQIKQQSNINERTGLSSKMLNLVIQIWESTCKSTLSKPCVTELLKKKLDNYSDLFKEEC